MPIVQFAEVPNESSISNNCCVCALMFIKYCSMWCPGTAAKFSEAVYGYGPIFMQLFQNVLSETKSINVIFLPYF